MKRSDSYKPSAEGKKTTGMNGRKKYQWSWAVNLLYAMLCAAIVTIVFGIVVALCEGLQLITGLHHYIFLGAFVFIFMTITYYEQLPQRSKKPKDAFDDVMW